MDGESEVPREAQKDPPDNRVIATESFRIGMDETPGDQKLKLKLSVLKTGFTAELDAESNQLTIQGRTAVRIEATGAETITAPHMVRRSQSTPQMA